MRNNATAQAAKVDTNLTSFAQQDPNIYFTQQSPSFGGGDLSAPAGISPLTGTSPQDEQRIDAVIRSEAGARREEYLRGLMKR